MKCSVCGSDNNDGASFCTNCGTPLMSGQQYAAQNVAPNVVPTANVNMNYNQAVNPAINPAGMPVMNQAPSFNVDSVPPVNPIPGSGMNNLPMTKDEFLKLPVMSKVKNNITAAAIICYVCAAITLIASLVSGAFPFDAIIIGILGLIIQLRKSFVASIALLAYSIFNVIVILVTTQTFGGWLILAAGIYAIASTYKLNKAFKNYLATGVIPSNMPVNQNNQGVA